MRFSTRSMGLGVALIVYIVCDVLLTSVARFETRPVSHVTTVGFVVLGLLFAGLVLAVLSIVMLSRRSARASTLAIIAALLYLPAVITEQTGHFSSLQAPAAIETIELVQVVVAVVVAGLALLTPRTGKASG